MADQISRVFKFALQTIVEATNLQKEIVTKSYILQSLFGAWCLLVQAYGDKVVNHINVHFVTFE